MLLTRLPNTEFFLFIVMCPWASYACMSSLALIGTGSAKALSSWSFNQLDERLYCCTVWSQLTYFDCRSSCKSERETNVGQHWRFSLGIYSALFPELRVAGILWGKQDPLDWNKSVCAMCPPVHTVKTLLYLYWSTPLPQSSMAAILYATLEFFFFFLRNSLGNPFIHFLAKSKMRWSIVNVTLQLGNG